MRKTLQKETACNGYVGRVAAVLTGRLVLPPNTSTGALEILLVSRLKTKHSPEQNAGSATTWDYNPDDKVQKMTDARGLVSNFSYNSRHLVIGIAYDPSTGVTDTADDSFAYDAAGNRTSMTDGSGTVSYSYNQLAVDFRSPDIHRCWRLHA
jgi:YD repeat-containing protein